MKLQRPSALEMSFGSDLKSTWTATLICWRNMAMAAP